MTSDELTDAAVRRGLDLGDPKMAHTLWMLKAAEGCEQSAVTCGGALSKIDALTNTIGTSATRISDAIDKAYRKGIGAATEAGLEAAALITAELLKEIKCQVKNAQIRSYGLIAGVTLLTAAASLAVGYCWATATTENTHAAALMAHYQCAGGKRFVGADGGTYCQSTWRLR